MINQKTLQLLFTRVTLGMFLKTEKLNSKDQVSGEDGNIYFFLNQGG